MTDPYSNSTKMDWIKAAQAATPKGSEYCCPKYTTEFLMDMKNQMIRAKIDLAKARKRIFELEATQ